MTGRPIVAGRYDAADRRRRSALRPCPVGSGTRKRLQGLVAARGADALALAREFLPDGDLAGHCAAGHAGLDRAQPAQAGSGDAAHTRADRHGGGGAPSGSGTRRVLVRQQTGDDGKPGRGAGTYQEILDAAHAPFARHRGQRRRTHEHLRTDRARRCRHHDDAQRRRGHWRRWTRKSSTAPCSICACRTRRVWS